MEQAKKYMLTVAAGVFALSMATAASAQMMNEFDADADRMINMDEFGSGMGGGMGDRRFGFYDRDQDRMISPDEFMEGEFRRYDRDRDEMLNEEEAGMLEEDEGFFDMDM